MEENQIFQKNLSENILKEIEVLPMEFREKSEELKQLQIELNEIRSKFDQKEKSMNALTKEIIILENDLTTNLTNISKIKSEQKKIIDSLNEESFNIFREYFYKLPNNYQEIILIFLKYEGKFKDELNFLLIKYENLHQLLRDSYSYFKFIEENENDKYELVKDRINILKNKGKLQIKNVIDKKNDKLKLIASFELIINFIYNTFRIIDINKYNRKINKDIIEKSGYKQILFMQKKISEEIIKEKQEKLKNINDYIKHINNILIKYQNFFGNSNNNKINSNTNSNTNSIKKNILYNSRYNNVDNFGNNIFIESKQTHIKSIKNTNSDKILLNSNNSKNIDKYKNNTKDKIILKTNIKNEDKNINNNNNNINLNTLERKKINFQNEINNLSKKKFSPGTDPNTLLVNNENNIKIISIITSSKQNLDNKKQNKQNIINYENNHIVNSNSIDYNDKNEKNLFNLNSKEGKKIKIGSLSMYQSSTSKKYKSMIKANSFEQIESKKILSRPIINKDKNKSYTEIDDFKLDENNNDIKNNLKQYKERNALKHKKKYYYSYQMNNDSIENKNKSVDNNINKNENENKNDNMNLNNEKEDIEEDEKKTLVDSYNRHLLVDYNQRENIEENRRKNCYLSPGIYNNNRKIIKMFEMSKNKDKKYK